MLMQWIQGFGKEEGNEADNRHGSSVSNPYPPMLPLTKSTFAMKYKVDYHIYNFETLEK